MEHVLDSVKSIKQLINRDQEAAFETLLNTSTADSGMDCGSSGALQLLVLCLLLPSYEVVSMTITILLALSFSSKHGDTFTLLLSQTSTFQVFQHAMMFEIQTYSDNTANTKSAQKAKQQGSLLEDYVVILQKATAKDVTGLVSQELDGRLVEGLNQVVNYVDGGAAADQENIDGQQSRASVDHQNVFLSQNIKSILRFIAS